MIEDAKTEDEIDDNHMDYEINVTLQNNHLSDLFNQNVNAEK